LSKAARLLHSRWEAILFLADCAATRGRGAEPFPCGADFAERPAAQSAFLPIGFCRHVMRAFLASFVLERLFIGRRLIPLFTAASYPTMLKTIQADFGKMSSLLMAFF